MFKFAIKFIFYPIMIVMIGLYYFVNILIAVITSIVLVITSIKASKKEVNQSKC